MTIDLVIDGFARIWLWLAGMVAMEGGLTSAPQASPSVPPPNTTTGTAPFAIDLATTDVDRLIADHADACFRVA